MKVTLKVLACLSLFVCLFGTTVQAQKTMKAGEIVFDMEMEGMPPEAAAMMSDISAKMIFDKNNMKVVTDMGMMKTVVFMDNKNNTQTTTMDVMGQKIQIDLSPDEIKDSKAADDSYEIINTGETKDIAGYSCKKSVIKSNDGSVNVWVTDKIQTKGSLNEQYQKLEGFPLQFSIKQNGMNINMEAKEVIARDVKSDEFTIPSGYTKMTTEELQKMFGGM